MADISDDDDLDVPVISLKKTIENHDFNDQDKCDDDLDDLDDTRVEDDELEASYSDQDNSPQACDIQSNDANDSCKNKVSVTYMEASDIPFEKKCFLCSFSYIQFFDFYGDDFATLKIPKPVLPKVFELCEIISKEAISDSEMKMLDSLCIPLCKLLNLLKGETEFFSSGIWLEEVEACMHLDSESSHDTADCDFFVKFAIEELRSFVKFDSRGETHPIETSIENSPKSQIDSFSDKTASLDSRFTKCRSDRVDFLVLLLDAAAECTDLRRAREAQGQQVGKSEYASRVRMCRT
jgi:hypothetical protein